MKEWDYKQIGKLVTLAQGGNSDSFATLYALTYNKTYAYCCRYLHDNYLAQDAVSEIYIKALKNLDKLTEPELFISWLNKIAFNTCYDFASKRDGNTASTDDEDVELIIDEYESHNPESSAITKNEYSRLHSAIDSLPFKEQQAIKMKFFNHMQLDDIAKVMKASRSSVKRYIASGEDMLRKKMNSKGGAE